MVCRDNGAHCACTWLFEFAHAYLCQSAQRHQDIGLTLLVLGVGRSCDSSDYIFAAVTQPLHAMQ